MKTSRQRLLEFIKAHRVVTVADISRAMRMTAANARHHLAILEEQGLVEVVGQRLKQGRGRPAMLFKLSEQALGDNLDQLASALLKEFIENLPKEERSELLQRISQHLAGETGQKPGINMTQRLYQAVQRLNELNYQARWEAHADAPRVILGHCPYAAILSEHPVLCQMDGMVLEALLHVGVKQTAKQEVDPQGATYCVFAVGKRSS